MVPFRNGRHDLKALLLPYALFIFQIQLILTMVESTDPPNPMDLRSLIGGISQTWRREYGHRRSSLAGSLKYPWP